MESKSPQSKGGIATALILRKNAIDKYMQNPNYCLFCNSIILIKDGQRSSDARAKKFCSHSCAAKFGNSKRWADYEKPEKIKKPRKAVFGHLENISKGEFFLRCKNWQSARSQICKHARFIKGEKTPCANCNYKNHVELCHIKSVSSFSDEALITEINAPENLIYLCPNCHWEFDNNILNLPKGVKGD